MECPTRKNGKACKTVKRVQTERKPTYILKENEMMAKIGDFFFPMTIDSGAEVTLVPKEFVDPMDLNGINRKVRWGLHEEGVMIAEEAVVTYTLGGSELNSAVTTVPGERIG